jgi:hypothetical protein
VDAGGFAGEVVGELEAFDGAGDVAGDAERHGREVGGVARQQEQGGGVADRGGQDGDDHPDDARAVQGDGVRDPSEDEHGAHGEREGRVERVREAGGTGTAVADGGLAGPGGAREGLAARDDVRHPDRLAGGREREAEDGERLEEEQADGRGVDVAVVTAEDEREAEPANVTDVTPVYMTRFASSATVYWVAVAPTSWQSVQTNDPPSSRRSGRAPGLSVLLRTVYIAAVVNSIEMTRTAW